MVPELVREVCARRIDAVTFTSAAGAQALVSAAAALGLAEDFAAAFHPGQDASARAVVAATVGPVTAQPLEEAGIPAVVPERFRLGAMVRAVCDHASEAVSR